MGAWITIRPFAEQDAAQVRNLFITVNRLVSRLSFPPADSRISNVLPIRFLQAMQPIFRQVIVLKAILRPLTGFLSDLHDR